MQEGAGVKCKTSGIDPKFCTCVICQPPVPGRIVKVDYAALAEKYGDPKGCANCGAVAGCCAQYPNCPGNPEWKPPAQQLMCTKCPVPGVLDFVSVNSDAYRCRHCGELTSGLELIQRKP